MKRSDKTDVIVQGDFAGADDILCAASNGALPHYNSVQVAPSGRIGPLIEILMARQASAEAMCNVILEMPFARLAAKAIAKGSISGTAYQAKFGVFPSSRLMGSTSSSDEWILWCSRAEQAAVSLSFPPPLAAGVIGAAIELHENVHIHSERPETGIVAYAASAAHFEIVIADAGVGVLTSLRQNPLYAAIDDAGVALMTAVGDGNSRFGSAEGRGYGMGQMFRALANHDGELRFRSDDYALFIRGHSPSLSGSIELRHKTRLAGLIISVRCPAPGASLDN